MENLDWLTIVSIVLGAVATLFGVFFGKVKAKLTQIVTAAKEVIDVGRAFNDALADNVITKEEVEKLKTEWREALVALIAIIGK